MSRNPEEKKLDVYELVRLIGSGGMGEVYEARHTLIGRRCAIKVLHQILESNEELLTRMIREAQAASGIGHPNIIEVYDFRKAPNGSYYMVMELLEGESLEELLDRVETLQPEEALVIISQVLSALRAAHDKGIVHRDLKPDNVFIAANKKGGWDVKVLDFGISKFTDPAGENMKLTKTGAVMGSPYYMSPEQASGKSDIDERADLWACGVMLFEMLSGIVPFPGNNYNEVLANILLNDPPDISEYRTGLDQAVIEIMAIAMCRDRSGRYKNADEMLASITPLLPNEPIEVRGYCLSAQGSDFEKQKSDTGWIKVVQNATRPDDTVAQDEATETGSAQGVNNDRFEVDGSKGKATRLYGEKSSSSALTGDHGQSGSQEKENLDPEGKVTTKETPRQAALPALPGSPKTTVTSGENISQSIALAEGSTIGDKGLTIRIGLGLGALAVALLAIGLWFFSQGDKDRSEKTGVQTSRTDMPGDSEKARHETEEKDLPEKPDEKPISEPYESDQDESDAATEEEKKTETDDEMIGVAIENIPENTRIWLDGRPIEPPIRVDRENRQRCLHFIAPGYQPYTRCFFAHEDRVLKLRMKRGTQRKKTSPKSIYDSPY